MKLTSQKVKTFSIALIALSLVITIFLGTALRKDSDTDIGDYSDVKVQDAIDEYEADSSGEKLAWLCHVLCYHSLRSEDEKLYAAFLKYGKMLIDGAKDGRWDLEALDHEEESLAKVIQILRWEGIR